MEKYAMIPSIQGGVAFSDPHYDASVWCQYRKEFSADNWFMKMETDTRHNFVEFNVIIGRPTMLNAANVNVLGDEIELSYPARYNESKTQIGMDTAQIFCGSMKNFDAFGESAALRTGTDGFFGDLYAFTCKGENDPAGFILIAGIEEMFATEEKLFQHFVSSFGGKEITRAEFEHGINENGLAYRVMLYDELSHARKAINESAKEKGGNEPER